jgi:D-tyrosyl-tRNA(Tyr) deacylase
VFEDDARRMNLSVSDVGAEILCVSNFTLYGDTRKGNRPSFVDAAPPADAEPLYERVRAALGAAGGVFGARMAVSLVNDGPVTLVLDA